MTVSSCWGSSKQYEENRISSTNSCHMKHNNLLNPLQEHPDKQLNERLSRTPEQPWENPVSEEFLNPPETQRNHSSTWIMKLNKHLSCFNIQKPSDSASWLLMRSCRHKNLQNNILSAESRTQSKTGRSYSWHVIRGCATWIQDFRTVLSSVKC